MKKTNEQIAMTAGRNSIIVNVLLSAFKLFAGILGNSAAMVADAVHSISDVLSTMVALVGVKLANRKPDENHPYGHERFESVATLFLAALITVVGVGIGWTGVQMIISGEYQLVGAPGRLAMVAAILSIAVKEAVYWYMRAAAKKIDSSALMADAVHSRTDSLSSVGSLIGILGARIGFPIMDSIAAIVICLFILKTAVGIFMDAIGRLTDKAVDNKTAQEIRQVILAQAHVDGIDRLRTRLAGNRIYVDVDICVNATATLQEAHDIAQHVHDAIESTFPKVKHCMVHVNPSTLNVDEEQDKEA
ncbi:MAG: cation diffusion facilitator family transporter [Defluviitaleaceae bacterium]|nr:cation diffusion facilitator family transporter [Defluviitaleaceae bacterium]